MYLDYARRCYGEANAGRIADIINENEPLVVDSWDCGGNNRVPDEKTRIPAEIAKAEAQLAVIDQCIAECKDRAHAARLRLLRNRILGVKLHHGLYESVAIWDGLPGAYADWTQSYLNRVIDMQTRRRRAWWLSVHDSDALCFQKGFRLTCRCGETAHGQKEGPAIWNPSEACYTTYTWVYQW